MTQVTDPRVDKGQLRFNTGKGKPFSFLLSSFHVIMYIVLSNIGLKETCCKLYVKLLLVMGPSESGRLEICKYINIC